MTFWHNYANTRVTRKDQKLGTIFQINDKTKDQHRHDLVYYSKYLEPTCNKDYLGETERRIIGRSADHCGKDKQSLEFDHLKCSISSTKCSFE